MTKLVHPAAERNKEPILGVLRRVLPSTASVLEIAGGSGQHAAFFAENLPGITWLPTDIEAERLASIDAWCRESKLANFLAPRALDVLDDDWGLGSFDAVFNANFIHITPWKCCLGLLAGARRHLHTGGLLIFYGPFRIGGEHTAPSNATFDDDLRGRNPEWGVRDLEAVVDAAEGFMLEERVEMPANNQVLIFRRT
jgi:SAM-dependent methyltransferase